MASNTQNITFKAGISDVESKTKLRSEFEMFRQRLDDLATKVQKIANSLELRDKKEELVKEICLYFEPKLEKDFAELHRKVWRLCDAHLFTYLEKGHSVKKVYDYFMSCNPLFSKKESTFSIGFIIRKWPFNL